MNSIPTVQTMSARIRAMLAEGTPDATIAQTLGVPVGRVYGVRSYDNRKLKPKKTKTKTKKTMARAKPVRIATKRGVDFVPTFLATPPSLWERIRSVFR